MIIGGGDGGSGVSQLLRRKNIPSKDITILEPSKTYVYQSGQTMIGGGLTTKEKLFQPMDKRHQKYDLINKEVEKVIPKENKLITKDGEEYSYEVLVISSGIHPKKDSIKGLKEALDNPSIPVGCNYFIDTAEKMNQIRKEFSGGKFLFTSPSTPIKCGGAPIKIAFLCQDTWKEGIFDYQIEFRTGTPVIFPQKDYAAVIRQLMEQEGMQIFTQNNLVEIDGKNRKAIFEREDKKLETVDFDGMHVTPLMFPNAFIKESSLATETGFVNVDIKTLQHKEYKNIFALGDCAQLPTSKTLSAINEQIHVVTKNIESFMKKEELKEQYNGYTACPVFTSRSKVMLCEFGYDQKMLPTFFKDQKYPSDFAFFLKTQVFNRLALQNVCHYVGPMRKMFPKLWQ